MTANERREAIIDILYERRKDTMANLANEFQVSIRTIHYDIEKLSLSHPIVTIQGNGGGVKIMEGSYRDRKYLNSAQEKLLDKLSKELSGDDLAVMNSILKDFALSS